MPLFARNTLVLAKNESPYGTDASPAGADAIWCRNVRLTPMNAEFASRDLIRPYMGNSENLPAGVHGMLEFETELQGSGTAATAPKWGRLLRGAGHSETILAAPVTGTAQAGGASAITLAVGASGVDGFYTGMTISLTGGTGNGQSAVIVGYVGATKVATVAHPWTTPPDATSLYSIGANVQYRLVSSAFEGLTLVTNMGGLQHKFVGSRGSVAPGLSAKGIPILKFRMLGLYATPTDTAAATPDYSAFKTPLVANSTNTPVFALHGVSPIVKDFSLDVANQVVFRALIGSESIQQTDRKPTGSIVFEANSVATKDWWTIAKNATLGALAVTHGVAAGLRVNIVAPSVQIQPPTYSEDQGVLMLNAGLIPVPVVGNDELIITAF